MWKNVVSMLINSKTRGGGERERQRQTERGGWRIHFTVTESGYPRRLDAFEMKVATEFM